MKRIGLVGSQEMAARIKHYLETSGFAKVVGFFDDYLEPGTLRHGQPVLGGVADIAAQYGDGKFDEILLAIGYKHLKMRKRIYQEIVSQGVPFATFIHPSAHVEQGAQIGSGSIVLVDCTIDMDAVIEPNVFVSSRTFISHHVRVGAHSFLAPSLNLAGHTTVGECCFLGIGTTTIDGVKLGALTRSAAGSVITKDSVGNELLAGVPAVVKKKYDP